jgi:hypothetical protein
LAFILTVSQLFRAASLSAHGPVPWGDKAPDLPEAQGVYVVARVGGQKFPCQVSTLPLADPVPSNLVLNQEYEARRWLPTEPAVYIGQTTRSLRERIHQFFRHKVGHKGPHAGGQVIILLGCPRWVYWSLADSPKDAEAMMISAFEKKVHQLPYGNKVRREPKRIRCQE